MDLDDSEGSMSPKDTPDVSQVYLYGYCMYRTHM